MELAITVIKLLDVATITEFIAYLATSPVPNTAWKLARVNPRGSKLGGKVNKLLGDWNAEKMAQTTGTRKTMQTASAQQSYAAFPRAR